jgi:hypothetical protein
MHHGDRRNALGFCGSKRPKENEVRDDEVGR